MTEQDLAALLRADGEIITARLDHWAATRGEQPFFHYGEDDVTLTYAEFGRRTDAIAGNLAARGVRQGDRISVFCTNPMVSALVMFGAWKAGALFCPVNFSYTGRLLSYQLDDTRPGLVVTEPTLLPALNAVVDGLAERPSVVVHQAPPGAHDHADNRVPSLLEELPWDELTADAEAPGVAVGVDDPANNIYTSRTTGPAKGGGQPVPWVGQDTFNLRMPLTRDDRAREGRGPAVPVDGAVHLQPAHAVDRRRLDLQRPPHVPRRWRDRERRPGRVGGLRGRRVEPVQPHLFLGSGALAPGHHRDPARRDDPLADAG